MLPDFPVLKKSRFDALIREVRETSRAKHGVLPQIRHITQQEGNTVHATTIQGDVAISGYESFHSQFEVKASELPLYEDDRWRATLSQMADEFANSEMRLFLSRLEQSTRAVGNVVDGGGGPLTEQHILEMFDRVDLEFENGEIAPGFSFLTSPAMAKQLADLQTSKEFETAYARIIERKQLEWRLRQADRKLVD